MGKYFETDGFRGEANVRLTSDHAYKIGRFLGWYYKLKKSVNNDNTKSKIIIGKDTRRSGYMLEYALISGIVSSGSDAYMLHVTTTPSVCYLAKNEGFDCGIMISASHNPYQDNGIKLINSNGEKMEDAVCELCEAYLDNRLCFVELFGNYYLEIPFATGEEIGMTIDYINGREKYIEYLKNSSKYSLVGKKIALDCANGSAWYIAPEVFLGLGAEIDLLNVKPNGTNINVNCGSTYIEALRKHMIEHDLDIGFAYDGDADRCFVVDKEGTVIDGNGILYIAAKYLKEKNELNQNTVVATTMCNYGLFKSLEKYGISCVATQVGDRFISECMRNNNYSLGGEESGHIIFSKYSNSGDGILTSLRVLEIILDKQKSLKELTEGLIIYPHEIVNVRVNDKDQAMNDEEVVAKYKELEARLKEIDGRIIFRKSGTEPLVRVLVETVNEEDCLRYANELADVIRKKYEVK